MRHILFAITMLMLCLSVNGQELKVTGSRKAVRTSGDVLVFITPVASLATVLATQDWQGLKQGVFTGGYDIGRNLCAEIPSEERAARLQR